MNKLKSNILYNMAYSVLNLVLPFITAPYVSRIFGKNGIGIYSYTHSIANYFVLFAMLGLANYGNRSIAQIRDNKEKLSQTFSEIYTMQLVTSVFSLIVYYISVVHIWKLYAPISLIQIFYVTSAVFDISWFFHGIEEFKMLATRNGIIKLVTTILVFSIVRHEADLWKYTIILALGYFLNSIYLLMKVRKVISFKLVGYSDIKKHIKPNLILFIPVIAVSLYRIMDKIMIGFMTQIGETGLYDSADRLVTIPLTLISAIGTVLMPRITNMIAKGEMQQTKTVIRKSLQFNMFLSIGMAFGMIAIAKKFVPSYYGSDFIGAISIVIILSPTLIINSLSGTIRTNYLIPNGKDNIYIVSVVSGAIVNLIINFILIPILGGKGAAIGTLLAELTVVTVQSFEINKDIKILDIASHSWEFLLSGAIMLCSVLFISKRLSDSILSVLVEIIIGAMVYLLISLVLIRSADNKLYNDFRKLI